MPDLHTTVPTGPSVKPLVVMTPPFEGLVSTHGPWIQNAVFWLRAMASSKLGNQLSSTVPNETPPWPVSVEPALTQWPAVSRKRAPVDRLRRLKPAEHEAPLIESPPSMKLAAVSGAD